MRIAVLSDIHANLPALEAVLADLDDQGADRLVHLGDCVGYGPDPVACLRLLRERGAVVVQGNHEHALLNPVAKGWFNASARKAVEITEHLVPEAERELLRAWPTSVAFDGLRFVHGFPRDNAFLYLFAADDDRLMRAFAEMDEDVCFVGHTHDLELVCLKNGELARSPLAPGVTELDLDARCIINVGSVGQPRDDWDNRAKYAVFDTQARSLDLRGVAYAFEGVARRIKALGIPDTYADRLAGPRRG